MPDRSNSQSGKDAERQALEHLQHQGLRLLAQNWLCKRGELDLVMLDGDTERTLNGVAHSVVSMSANGRN
jgi:putative endonuclease